jgi:ribosomal protein S6
MDLNTPSEIKSETMLDAGTIYEVSYLLLPSLSGDNVSTQTASIVEMFQGAGGKIISQESPVLIDLSYSMTKVIHTVRHKCDTAYFGWVKFELSAEEISKVKKSLDANDNVLRYLIIKTVKENTLLNGKMNLRKEEKVRKDMPLEAVEADAEVLAPLDVQSEAVAEDLDKSIDDLVIA